MWFFIGGLAIVLLSNWLKSQQDRARIQRLRSRIPEPIALAQTPPVSVLVAAWNEAPIIERHIRSFLQLRYPHAELILCAGGVDDTCNTASRFAGERVTVLEQQPGEGKQRALRRCLERARGDVVFLTDADCLLDDEAFEQTLAPIVNEGESVTTGTSRPLAEQMANPFVLMRWFTDIYGRARWGDYTDGILGRNAAIRRDVLAAVGGFDDDVATGTDYYLAQMILKKGYRIRHAPGSIVESRYAATFSAYLRQQTRWLRNGVIHGLRFGDYGEVVRCLVPSAAGLAMLCGPVAALWLGTVVWAGWLLVWVHACCSRWRYVRFGASLTGCPFPVKRYVYLPGYVLTDFMVWAWTLAQYPVQTWRSKW
ncbi:MAG: glycosyltransferase [Anaerolineae bacterium]|nr:glycosyltransferase [Anaerolineae bacterium]